MSTSMPKSVDSAAMKPLSRVMSNHKLGVIFILIVLLLLLWFKSETRNTPIANNKPLLKHVNKFSNQVLKYDIFRLFCYRNTDPKSIKDLNVYIKMLKTRKHLLCQKQYKLFKSIYQLRIKYAAITLSEAFKLRINKSLHVNKKLIETTKNQSLLFVDNLYTLESVVYNTVRVTIPDVVSENVSAYIKRTVDKSRNRCDFCAFAENTAADTFGRMESTYAVIVSNAFKIQKYHGLAILKEHHPLVFDQTAFIDCMHLIMKWFDRVHEVSPDDIYRIIYWDLLLRAGVSQMHPHMHLTLGTYEYFAKWNELYNAGLRFSKEHGSMNYWTSLLQIHTSLGLTVSLGNASLMVYLTPKRDNEVFVISEKPSLDFFRLVFFAIRSFIDDLKEPSITMGWVFPRLYTDMRYGDELPMLFRICSRGDLVSLQSDVSSMDLYGTANVNKDPFKAIEIIRESVMRRTKETFDFPEWKYD